jgi:hypothetical protein
MGDIIDLEKIDEEHNLRCQHAKLGVIIVNFIGVPSSLIILIFCIIRMFWTKKRFSFLTKVIILLFSFEITNCISKLLQLFKYSFEDSRTFPDPNIIETPRGIICQIQIVLSIISDYGCLLGTLLLSLRCYGVIKNKIRFLDFKKWQNLSLIAIIFISSAFALLFWGLDKDDTKYSIGFKYDRRDRCNYWCWLGHYYSRICYAIYLLLLIVNIIIFSLTTAYFRNSYKNLVEKCVVTRDEPNLSNNIRDNIDYTEETKENRYISPDDKKRLKELQIMHVKCFIYPIISIIIWFLSFIYRIIDDTVLFNVDNGIDGHSNDFDILSKNRNLQRFIEASLIFHTILSSFRGIFYGYAFAIFEDKAFSNNFKETLYKISKKCCCFCPYYNLDVLRVEGEDEEDTLINTSANSETNQKDNYEETKFRKSNVSDYGRNNTTDLNTSDYRYND